MPATLNSFSGLVQDRASQIRNCANEPDMRAWLEALFLEKFNSQDERAQKAWAWCSTVGRKYMLREGASIAFAPSPSTLAAAPRWILDAVEAGKLLTALSLAPAERELFSSILDWMRSPSGPSLNSDWSKISVPQAKAAELAWIDAMAKAAAKKDLEAADAAGTALFSALGLGASEPEPGASSGPEWAGWRWVAVKSADALDREGSLMRHCVGSYADDVASGEKQIYSLRDPSNTPRLTVEAQGAKLSQIKAFANAACPAGLLPAVAAFATSFEADAAARGLGEAFAPEELGEAGLCSLPTIGLVAGWLSAGQADKLRRLADQALAGSEEAQATIGRLAPGLAGLGLSADLATSLRFSPAFFCQKALLSAARNGRAECLGVLIPLSDPKADNSRALSWAARKGHLECLDLLIPVSDPKASESQALALAAWAGHAECVKRLIPISNPHDPLPLCWAASNDQIECVKLLIIAPPPFNLSLAISRASSNGHAECVKILLAVPGALARLSPEPLRWAARAGRIDCVELLLPHSDPLAPEDESGLNALGLAQRENHSEVAALIGRFIEEQIDGGISAAACLDKPQAVLAAKSPSGPVLLLK